MTSKLRARYSTTFEGKNCRDRDGAEARIIRWPILKKDIYLQAHQIHRKVYIFSRGCLRVAYRSRQVMACARCCPHRSLSVGVVYP